MHCIYSSLPSLEHACSLIAHTIHAIRTETEKKEGGGGEHRRRKKAESKKLKMRLKINKQHGSFPEQ